MTYLLPGKSSSRPAIRDTEGLSGQSQLPPKTIVWRSDRAYSAAELVQLIKAGDQEGRRYGADLLRTARDLLARKAMRAS